MTWAAAGVAAAAGFVLGPAVDVAADAAARRRELAARPLPHRRAALAVVLAAAGAGCGARFGAHALTAVAVFFCAALATIVVTDVEHRIVPNDVVIPAAAIVLACRTILHPTAEWAVAAAAVGGFLLAAALVYPAGLGIGDVKLGLLLGAMLGRATVLAVVVGFGALVPVAITILARRGSAGRKVGVPLAPFLALGGLVALLASSNLLD